MNLFSQMHGRLCITSLWLSLLTEYFQLTIAFVAKIWNTDTSKILSASTDPVHCATLLRKIECIFKHGYPIKWITSWKHMNCPPVCSIDCWTLKHTVVTINPVEYLTVVVQSQTVCYWNIGINDDCSVPSVHWGFLNFVEKIVIPIHPPMK